MNIKIEAIALIVRILTQKNIIAKPDPFSELFSVIFGGETYDKRIARTVVETGTEAAEQIKSKNTDRKFKKIIKESM